MHRTRTRVAAAAMASIAAVATGVGIAAAGTAAHAAPVATTATPTYAKFITVLYEELLSRTPTQSDIAFWTHIGQTQGLNYVTEDIDASPENSADNVREDYDAYLSRTPTASELSTWTAEVRSGREDNELTATLLASDEFYARATQSLEKASSCEELFGSLSPSAAAALSPRAHARALFGQRTSAASQARPAATETTTAAPPQTESAPDRWLDFVYCSSLDRLPDNGGRAYFDGILGSQPTSTVRYRVSLAAKRSPENMESWAGAIYFAALGRAPSATEFASELSALVGPKYNFKTFQAFARDLGTPEGFAYNQEVHEEG